MKYIIWTLRPAYLLRHTARTREGSELKPEEASTNLALIGGDAIRYVNRVGGFGELELRRAPPLVRRRCPDSDSASAEAFSRSLKYIILVLIRRSPGLHPMYGSRRGTVPQGDVHECPPVAVCVHNWSVGCQKENAGCPLNNDCARNYQQVRL